MMSSIPGLFLAFLETVMLAAIGVALSTRLPMLANLIVCCSIYVVGHLVPMLVMSRIGDTYGIVRFVGQLIAAVFPVLEHFDIEATVATGNPVPLDAHPCLTGALNAGIAGVGDLLDRLAISGETLNTYAIVIVFADCDNLVARLKDAFDAAPILGGVISAEHYPCGVTDLRREHLRRIFEV